MLARFQGRAFKGIFKVERPIGVARSSVTAGFSRLSVRVGFQGRACERAFKVERLRLPTMLSVVVGLDMLSVLADGS